MTAPATRPARRLRNRHRLRDREVAALEQELSSIFGSQVSLSRAPVEQADWGGWDIIFVGKDPAAFRFEGYLFLTVQELIRVMPARRAVTVDMGAVPYVCNGADVMGPGIVECDPDVRQGDLVWVRDMKNRRPLAVGRALVDAAAMARRDKGKAVSALLFVGDELWLMGKE